jgi:hypothetical protein
MEGQEEGETFYEENGSSTEDAAKDTNNITLPIGKKNVVQINFFKDRTSGMYKCQMCSYKSMHRSSIKSHYAVHSSLRPYACDQCSYEAKRLNDLRKHKLIKHGKKLISVRKKHNSAAAGTNGVSGKSPKYAESDNNESHMEEQESEGGVSGNLLYQSLLGSGTNSNGPVFPQPEPANVASSPNTSSSPCHERSISASDLPEEIDKEGTVVVKPEPPDDYYTFQNKFPEQDDPIVIPPVAPTASETVLKSSGCSPSKSPSRASPAAALKSLAQSTSGKDAGDSEATRLHAASPSVISLLLQRRNLTGSSLISSGGILNNTAHSSSSSQPKALKPVQRSTPTLYASAVTDSRFSAPQYNSHNNHNSHNNPLNLSFNHSSSSSHQHGTSVPTRSNSESSSASASAFPSSTSGRSRGVETARGWTCDHCNIMFFDSAIYFMHMGLHAPDAAWQCNLCGKQLYDVYSFTSHFLNGHVAT